MNSRATNTRFKTGRLWVQPVRDRRSQAILTPHFLPKTGETDKSEKTSLNETGFRDAYSRVQSSDERAGRGAQIAAPFPPSPLTLARTVPLRNSARHQHQKGTFLIS
jgi:hypothetical protein